MNPFSNIPNFPASHAQHTRSAAHAPTLKMSTIK